MSIFVVSSQQSGIHEKEKSVICFDRAIKHLLRDKANHIALEGFLTSWLGREIKILDFLENEGSKN